MKVDVLTRRYSPFRLGGDLMDPVKTKVEAHSGPHDLGCGYSGYIVEHPFKTGFHVVEATTGALVGYAKTAPLALASAIQDVATGDPKLMREQVEEAAIWLKRAEGMPKAAFFALLK